MFHFKVMKKMAVIGLGFGDEGKGLTTDWLCGENPNAEVIRFCGGHQAGHTVCYDNKRHIFSNFGSGSLRGNSTFWTRFCCFEPLGWLNEYKNLRSKGLTPKFFISPYSPITTPFEIFANRKDDKNIEHGTCGLGVGATFAREENNYPFRYSDLFFKDKVDEILNNTLPEYYKMSLDKELIEIWKSTTYKVVEIISNITRDWGHETPDCLIFEGAQGLMLDRDYGYFPHVTRSKTDMSNINCDCDDVYLITRCYATRHGNGPLPNEDIKQLIVEDGTNINNEWQGKFRAAPLTLETLQYARSKIKADNVHLVVTHIDQWNTDMGLFIDKEYKEYKTVDELLNMLYNSLNVKNCYISDGKTAKNIKRFI